MFVTTKAIVISTIKYQEKSLIVKCFTESNGIKTYFVPNAFSAKKSTQKIAYFQPLNILEIQANHKNTATLHHFKEIRLAVALQSISSSIIKTSMVLFLSEVLQQSIKEEEKNTNLFSFLETAIIWLDTNTDIANFHLIFLLEISKHLGFYPEVSNADLPFFEMTEGVFTSYHGLSCLSDWETILFKKVITLKLDNNQKIFTVSERQIILKVLLDYYSYHLSGFKKPKSVEVLREIFNS